MVRARCDFDLYRSRSAADTELSVGEIGVDHQTVGVLGCEQHPEMLHKTLLSFVIFN